MRHKLSHTLQLLRRNAFNNIMDSNPLIKQIAQIELTIQPTPNERTFKTFIMMAMVFGQGCCYTARRTYINKDFLGCRVDIANDQSRGIQLAVLDAVFAGLSPRSQIKNQLTGSLTARSRARAEFVVDIMHKELSLKSNQVIMLIGTVGEFIREFKKRGLIVHPYDLDKTIIGNDLYGTKIIDGTSLRRSNLKPDAVLATGMTLWNGTFEYIKNRCLLENIPLFLFAETGAHIAPYLIEHGVQGVFSEPFPFYVFGEQAVIKYYNKINPIKFDLKKLS